MKKFVKTLGALIGLTILFALLGTSRAYGTEDAWQTTTTTETPATTVPPVTTQEPTSFYTSPPATVSAPSAAPTSPPAPPGLAVTGTDHKALWAAGGVGLALGSILVILALWLEGRKKGDEDEAWVNTDSIGDR